jgi:hypothetical protein
MLQKRKRLRLMKLSAIRERDVKAELSTAGSIVNLSADRNRSKTFEPRIRLVPLI